MELKCEKCGNQLIKHYEVFCPKCNTECFIIGKREIYDLYKLMYYMEAHGYMSKDKYYRDYLLEQYTNLHNDTYLNMYFDDREEDGEEINRYHEKVRELLNIDYEDSVIMRVSC